MADIIRVNLTIEDINIALKSAGCASSDIEYCSVTSTQNIEYIISNPKELTFEIDLQNKSLGPHHWAANISATHFQKRLHRYSHHPPLSKESDSTRG